MGSKCAVLNLGQSESSTFFFFLSVWSGVTLMFTHDSASLFSAEG